MKEFEKKVQIYVDPVNGSDENRGGKKAPLLTLEKAYEILQQKVAHTDLETAYTVYLMAGEHILSSPLLFDGKSVRASDFSLDIVGCDGAVITSAKSISGNAFQKVEGKPYYAYTLSEDASFRDILCNGKFVPMAQSEKDNTMMFSIPNDKDRKAPENEEPKLYVSEESLTGIDLTQNFSLEIWLKVEWQMHALRLIGVDPTDVKTDENGKKHIAVFPHADDWRPFILGFYATLRGRAYRFHNHISALTSENSYYYDQRTRTLYLYPASDVDMASATVAYPRAENLLLFRNTRNVTLRGITFTGVTSNYVSENGYVAGQGGRILKDNIGFLTHAAVQSENGHNFSVLDCYFHDIGCDGVNTSGITDGVTVEHCRFETIGMSAIRIGKCTKEWNYTVNINQNVRIVHNYIRHPGTVYTSNTGIAVGSVWNLTMHYNTLIDTPYSAISIGWCWGKAEYPVGSFINILNADIAYNRVENFMYCMKDGGAIYTLGGNCDISDHNYYNFIHDNYCVGGPTCGRNTGGYTILYHDGSSSNWKTSQNVIVINPDAPSKFSYVSYQSIPSQQVYNMMTEGNYFVNLDDPFYVLGKGGNDPERNRAFFLKQKNNKVGLTMETLDKKARKIIENAGANGYKAKI